MKKIISEITILEPVPIKPGHKSNFGQKRSYEIHPGDDIGVPVGTPVLAPMDGEVIFTDTNVNLCGATIDIDYKNGFKSRFCHMSRIDVKKGDIVTQGQVVGLSGGKPGTWGAGNSQGPHLHFTLKLNGKNVDPMLYINKTYEPTQIQNQSEDQDLTTVVNKLKDLKKDWTLDDLKKQFPQGIISADSLNKMFSVFTEEVTRIKKLMK